MFLTFVSILFCYFVTPCFVVHTRATMSFLENRTEGLKFGDVHVCRFSREQTVRFSFHQLMLLSASVCLGLETAQLLAGWLDSVIFWRPQLLQERQYTNAPRSLYLLHMHICFFILTKTLQSILVYPSRSHHIYHKSLFL